MQPFHLVVLRICGFWWSWPVPSFLILALSGSLALYPSGPSVNPCGGAIRGILFICENQKRIELSLHVAYLLKIDASE
jgi:hypothetical protein